MHAGMLDRPITLQRATSSNNEFNEPILTWATFGTDPTMAAKSYKGAGEQLSLEQVVATLITRFTIRWALPIADLNPKDRLIERGVIYQIINVYEIGRQKWLEIHSVARVD